uniref:Coronin n=1 Tax=Strigamia maritima TaxID=126957 RepID=T1JFZ6_STRMM
MATPVAQMPFRGVRSSKFRHVYGNPIKKEQCYECVKITKNAHDSHFCAVNPKFVAIVTEVAGGGSFLVLPLDRTGRVDINAGKVTGHRGPVLDVKWNPFNDNVIASCSDDCTVKLWYIPDEGLKNNLNDWLVNLQGHKRRVGYVEWHPTAENVLFSAGFDNLIILWNIGKGEAVNIIDCHPDIVHSMSFNRDGSLLATTCKDKILRVIEPRSGRVLQEGPSHGGTKASKVVFLGDSGRLFTTGFSRYSDRQYAVWSQKDLSKPLRIENIDSSSGVLFPYYDFDTKMVYLAGKGDGNIRYYEIVNEAPYVHYLNQFLSGFPQRGLGVIPKRGLDVLQCEVLRFYKLHAMKGVCEPISMIVPRKSEQFQDDLYPDTAAPTSSLTAEEWLKGKNRNPVLVSLKSGVVVRTNKPVIYKANDNTLVTSDRNNEKKFMFISEETKPDYREVPKRPPSPINNLSFSFNLTVEMVSDTLDGLGNRFHQIQQMWGNLSTKTTTNHTTNGVVMCDIVTTHKLPTATYITIGDDKDIEIIELNSPKTEAELRRAYSSQSEEIKTLKEQLQSKEKRVRDLEEQLRRLNLQNQRPW